MVNRTAEVYAEMMAGQASEASVNMEEEEVALIVVQNLIQWQLKYKVHWVEEET